MFLLYQQVKIIIKQFILTKYVPFFLVHQTFHASSLASWPYLISHFYQFHRRILRFLHLQGPSMAVYPNFISILVFPLLRLWCLYQKVTQNMLRTHEEILVCLEVKIRFFAALDIIKCRKEIRYQRWLLTCAPISELPYHFLCFILKYLR